MPLLATRLKTLFKKRFVRNVLALASGTAMAQIITILFSPLITRLYGPEAFGILGTFNAVLYTVSPLVALGYPMAFVLPSRDHEVIHLLYLSALISILISSITLFAIMILGDSLSSALNLNTIGNLIYLLPVAMIFISWSQMSQQWLIRKQQFSIVAKATVINSGLNNGFKALIGFIYPSGSVLIVLGTSWYAMQAMLMMIGIRRHAKPDHSIANPVDASSVASVSKRYIDFPLYRTPQNFVNVASQNIPVLMLAAFYGPAAAGFYALTRTVMGVPSMLIGKSVSDVFYSRAAMADRQKENLFNLVLKATLGMAILGAIPFVLIAFIGPDLFRIVFGEEWMHAGEYARWLALLFYFNFINKPSVALVPVIGLQRGLLIYEILSASVKLLCFLFGAMIMGDDLWAVALYSIGGSIAYLLMIMWIIAEAKKRRDYEKTS